MSPHDKYPVLTAEEAAALIPDGATVAFSGFTPAGTAKAVPRAIAARARELHERGEAYRLRVLAGASTGDPVDEALAEADAIAWRAPYQSSKTLRRQLNSGQVEFVDMHLSHLQQAVAEGFFGKVDFAVVEATEIAADGRVFLTTSIGASPTFLACAEKVIIEVNRAQSPRLREMADISTIPIPPHRSPIPIYDVMDRIGWPYAPVNPNKVVGIVMTDELDEIAPFTEPDSINLRIAANVLQFLEDGLKSGDIPPEFLPLQAGVGNVSNAVMSGLGASDKIPPFTMYTEVLQDTLVDLMIEGHLLGASTSSLTLTPEMMKRVFDEMDFFIPRIVMRPQELSNNPGVIRRLGVISLNTVLEVDIYGHANSTHVGGTRLMNGIGGSGDFCRNAYLSILMCPSTARGGAISTIVPMCPHVDHNEHSVQIVVTEQGLADLRGLGPERRARRLINHCAHPAYRDYLHAYLDAAPQGHIRHDLARCFEMHLNLAEHGRMLPELDPSQFGG